MKYFLGKNPNISRLRIALKHVKSGTNGNLKFHTHDATELVIVLNSTDTLHWVNRKSSQLTRGDILLLHPDIQHAYENCEHLELINILYNAEQLPLPLLDGTELARFKEFIDNKAISPSPEKPILHLSEEQLEDIEPLIKAMEKEIDSSNPGKSLCVFGLFIALMVKLLQTGGKQSHDVNTSDAVHALSYINMNFRENITVAHLAKMCNMSRAGFFRHFREMTGYSPLEYQRKKRLEMAHIMLQESDLSIGEIAQRCGFCDSNHLTKLFSREYSMPPRQLKLQKKLKATTSTTAEDSIPAAPEPVHQPL